ncbi:YdeI/OmpD-associated family protein [Winogradskyella sp. 3972H.M.0a.05]|uniref:YdeI/OmpD-associated family protein n=1 Tax=Winogradskyella sp. 3972H.M.0a.05 TaxID=2950277 RepID=UPI00339826F6
MKKIYSVEEYIETNETWAEGLTKLRNILLKTELDETVKWSIPTYTINNKNVAGIGAFKGYFGLWFFNGSFLKDEENVLINAQEGKTKGMRQWRFADVSELNDPLILKYVKEAIENQRQGLEIKPDRSKKETVVPELLQTLLNSNAALKSNFESLSPYKQREYCEYIDTAKRDATKQSRLEKITPMIEQGIGLNDKYRNC